MDQSVTECVISLLYIQYLDHFLRPLCLDNMSLD